MNNSLPKKIILTGGGTGGSVSPLLAIADECRKNKENFSFLWLGTKNGPEKEMVETEGIEFKAISSGKLRRYFSLQNFLDIFRILFGFFEALFIVKKSQADLVISAGGFVAVPVLWAAWFLRKKIIIHQQDVRPGLANKLTAPLAKKITVTFEKSLVDYGSKALWIGNPIRLKVKEKISLSQKKEFLKKLKLKENLPLLLVVGGGTGSKAINELATQSIDELNDFCQILHIQGKNKNINSAQKDNYLAIDFLSVNEMSMALKTAEVVVSRCGLGLLSEISYLKKPSLLIPIPHSHQEDNGQIFKQKKAGLVLSQNELNKDMFVSSIKKLFNDQSLRKEITNNLNNVIKDDANEAMLKIIKTNLK